DAVEVGGAGWRVEAVYSKKREEFRVFQRHRPKTVGGAAKPFEPVPVVRHGNMSLLEHQLDKGVHQMRLAGKVMIDAHGLAAEFGAKSSRTERRKPLPIDQRHRGGRNPLPR